MTARLDVTPKTIEQNRIVRTSKSEAEATNNKKTALEVLYYWRNEANYWQTRSIERPLCDSRATCIWHLQWLTVCAMLRYVSIKIWWWWRWWWWRWHINWLKHELHIVNITYRYERSSVITTPQADTAEMRACTWPLRCGNFERYWSDYLF